MAEREYKFKDDRPKSGWRFDWTISVGQIGSALLMILSVVVAYEKLEGRTTNNDASILELKESVKALNGTMIETNLSVRELKTTVQIEGRKTRDNIDQK